VPHGRTNNGGPGDRGAWHDLPARAAEAWTDARAGLRGDRRRSTPSSAAATTPHLGTLGTGNHFIEVCLDERDGAVWVMLHSGSRGVGNRIGSYFIELAKRDMRRWFVNLPDQDLAYLPEGTEHFDDYVAAVSWAQDYAAANRELMMDAVLRALRGGRPARVHARRSRR
jgi:tRNA-splicing ligase RtcB